MKPKQSKYCPLTLVGSCTALRFLFIHMYDINEFWCLYFPRVIKRYAKSFNQSILKIVVHKPENCSHCLYIRDYKKPHLGSSLGI